MPFLSEGGACSTYLICGKIAVKVTSTDGLLSRKYHWYTGHSVA